MPSVLSKPSEVAMADADSYCVSTGFSHERNPMPTNPDQVYRDEARAIVDDNVCENDQHQDIVPDRDALIADIASALAARGRVREGHVRDHDGNDWVVIVKTPVGVWPSDEMARVNVAGTTLLYVREAAQLPHP